MNYNKTLKVNTLTELFLDQRHENSKGITFVINKSEEIYRSYEDIFGKSLLILGYLQSKGLKAKDKLVFQLEDNFDFIHVFWACILGGINPVPIVAEEKDEHRRKLYNVLRILKNGYVIGKEKAIDNLRIFAEQEDYDYDSLKNNYLNVEDAFIYSGAIGNIHEAKPDDIAFIQFSSGSTGMPKGVILTHNNLIINLDAIIVGAEFNPNDVFVSWMPLTHDMGLIGCHLATTAANMAQCTMDIKLFVMRPTVWLEKITEHKATLLSSPNFGLKYSLSAMERSQKKNYDFSSVRLIFNGAEPISVKVCDEFLDKMSVFGLKSSVMFPVYGMAEASVAVSFPKLHEGQINKIVIDRNSLLVGDKVKYLTEENGENASCYVDEGYPVKNCELRICDNDDNVLPASTLGIIQIRGGNVSAGYYNNDEANVETRTSDGWFRTGDIGFICNDRIVVIGRSQDMVIVNGQNYFSNDLERIACEVEKVELNKVVVTSVIDSDTETEKIIVFIVHKTDTKKFVPIIKKIREHFAKSIGISIDYVVPVRQISKTSSGKLMRFTLKVKFEKGAYQEVIEQCNTLIREERLMEQSEQDKEMIEQVNKQVFNNLEVESEILSICQEISPELNLGLNDNFFEYGINSLVLNQIAARLDDRYPNKIKIEDFFQYSSVKKLSNYICEIKDLSHYAIDQNKNKKVKYDVNSHIAIIGMAVNVPGAANIEEFWGNLCGGVESVGPIPAGRKRDIEEYLNSLGNEKESVFRDSGFIYEIDKFDHEFFKILKREGIAMSPSQRLFLQTAYSSIENAGYGGTALKSSRTGVYVGYISDLDGYQYQDIVKQSKDSQSATGALTANISGRLSYFMDFKAPSILVDSACSSSMSALNLACQGIYNGDCDQAIVGGVQLKVLPMISHDNIGIESPDGHTRPFADDANGTGEGEGIVSILIKPYEKAVEDNDNIYAVIRSIHSNQDGYSVGLSAPNPEAQTALVNEALVKASVKAEEITYIEAHGTGTKLGDPIEIHALTQAYRMQTDREQFCALGSVKSNIGHLYASSGLVSLIKCSLMLTRRMIPASINIKALNSRIQFENSPFYVNLQNKKWETNTLPRRCGVSNFGFSGTNCHTILEEYIEPEHASQADKAFPFVLSATTRAGLNLIVKAYYDYLYLNSSIRLPDICFTTSMGRGHYQYRLAIVVKDTKELIRKLAEFEYATQTSSGIYVGSVKGVQNSRKEVQWGELTGDEIEQLNHSTVKSISSFTKSLENADRDLFIGKLCSLYVRGANPVWKGLFKHEYVKRISLPTYIFNAQRCWPQF